MADIIGVIAEYNPFHLGHLYHLNKIKELTANSPVVIILSSSCVQRGELACADKWTRAAWAVASGADLVLELPVIYSLRSGEKFARGAIASLAATGCVTHLSYGCETTEPELLQAIASLHFTSEDLAPLLAKGLPYGASLGKLIAGQNPAYGEIVKQSNNILALEYLRALRTLAPHIKPLPIIRQGSTYTQLDIASYLPSAMAIRTKLTAEGYSEALQHALPAAVSAYFASFDTVTYYAALQERLLTLLNYQIAYLGREGIAAATDASEGLENKIAEAIPCSSLPELLNKIKSKRYSASRIKRLLYQILLSLPDLSFRSTAGLAPSYLRILAFNDRGRNILRLMRQTSSLPILNNLPRNIFRRFPALDFYQTLRLEMRATDLFDLLSGRAEKGRDFTMQPVYEGCGERGSRVKG